jgi:GNAT superfamily N-acetyltransferase
VPSQVARPFDRAPASVFASRIMSVKLEIVAKPTEAEREAIQSLLVAFNETNGGRGRYQPFLVRLRDSRTGASVGGLWARRYYDWLYVDLLYVPEEARGSDVGSRLMAKAEAFARRNGCIGVWLSTYGFQAPGFYRKLGYQAFGTLKHHPPGKKFFLFRKLLDAAPAAQRKSASRGPLKRSSRKRRRRLP